MGVAKRFRQSKQTPVKKIVISIFIGLATLLCIGIIVLVVSTYQVASTIPELNENTIFNLAQNSRIYASDGSTVLAELQIENREPINTLNEVSDDVIKATIATEDARFYDHKGVDPLAMLRSFFVVFSGGSTQGGSTITMQLIRNTVLTKDAQTISLERKISEMLLALQVEQIYSKDQILLMYLNTINYGDRCYGIKAASKHYFSINPDKLNLEESATLVGIPQSPVYLSPTNNIEACKNRRDTVLGRMYEDGAITQEAYKNAEATPIELNVSYNDPSSSYKYPYFTNYVRETILDKYSNSEIFEGGFQIYTSLDIRHQEAVEEGCSKEQKKLEKDAEAVAVTMDQTNGFITGMVGGSDYSKNQYNIATTKGRPTGSSFKAFTLATAIEQGYDPFSYTIDCSSPYNIGNINVKNFGGISYGTKTIQGAVAVSSNTGLVRLQQKVGTQSVIDMAKKLGIKNADLQAVTTLTLGHVDITPVEMASAYATFANGGVYHDPVAITKIETASGDTIYSYENDRSDDDGKQVISEEVAGAVTKTLKTVFTQGTATSAQLNNKQPVAGKTGTSEDYRDHTLIGYTPYCVCAT